MNFLSVQGTLALASRLKVVSERSYDLIDQVYREHGVGLQARWFPVLRLLQERGPMSVGGIAREIGLTHSAISQLATRLTRAGLLRREPAPDDRRQRVLALTERCQAELKAARPLWQAMRETVEHRLTGIGVDLLDALSRYEASLDAQPLPAEVAERLRQRQAEQVRIVPYAPQWGADFYRLNAEWLAKYYQIEPIDHAVLSEPEKHILEPGGAILIALVGDEAVGTCALLVDAPGVYELTKMAVTERHQGLGIGRRLMEAAIAEFERLGGRELFLESQKRLQPALRLYESVGFELQPGVKPGTHYQRADVYMIYRGRKDAGR
ncbi:bifunctional helix-turn-helix transcriptional regulator/GNAT family N-acetyltransferase [Luteimonas sp. SJ-92]|uniref:Bifunctional helix-turn-helix transcriptional regulator/GNAT family N-acetyltransferase n=1 Tax=Luteimonas salinisoli TaxID=2752307 RepID=A0A853JA80_9GAMM|nr:bifunctional helix-turn-helix transcriptional regulator/GNAT family N-acetyltransferase [Luteimonas salinisoli]NZA25682.1 bifunctional helix-turn-helix transcriptional regulator/GNAT family N-acetyltransferase [Luteimonas salinisoli]